MSLKKCDSCGGDLYHYAGCGIGEHGERIWVAHPDGGAPPEPTIILTGNRNEFRGFDMVTRSTPEAQAIIQAAAAFWDYQRALRVRAASRPGHPEGGAP
jgi:hypothetical protein